MRGIVMLMCVVAMMIRSAIAAADAEDARFIHRHDKDHPHTPPLVFADKQEWLDRSTALRRQAKVALGLWPMPAKEPLKPVIHGRIDRGEYTIENVYFTSLPGHYVTGNLYRPKARSGRLPVVLCPYGHWPDGRFVWKNDAAVQKEIDLGAETRPEAARSPLQANCAMLARMGCIVFQYDMVGYCDSTRIEHRAGFLDAGSILQLQSFMGLQTWNSIRALDFVLSLPEVDPERIAVTGSSSGGTQTIALAAVDDRVAAAFPIVMVSMNMQGGCVCETAPLYRVNTNNVELASLFAPKPQGVAAANDWTHDFMTRGFPQMQHIWGLFGRANDLACRHFDFGHNHNLHSRQMQYSFLNTHLKLGLPEPVEELPFEPVPPAELSVYTAEHPRPTDEADATAVRAAWRRSSDAALAALDGDAREATVRGALEAMIVDAMPSPADVQVTELPAPPVEGGSEGTRAWAAIISRKGAGERIPCAALFPPRPNGTVTIIVHPEGCASLTADQKVAPSYLKLLENGTTIVAIDVFMSGDFQPRHAAPADAAAQRPSPNPAYAGYFLAYERSVLANRVHDLLTTIALVRSWDDTKRVEMLGVGRAGVWTLLAHAAAGDAVDAASVDLDQFDFDQVVNDADPMLLPGGLKYGGIYGFVPLCGGRATLLCNARNTGSYESAAATAGVTIEQAGRSTEQLIDWLLATRVK